MANIDDLNGATATLTAAFEHDPIWSWAFPDRNGIEVWWRFLIASALRYPWVWIAEDYAAVSVWIPPRGVELTDEEEASVEPMLAELLGPRAREVSALVQRFDDTHPANPPHYYLSLLGTHPEHRGRGLGMALLADNLAKIDSEGFPAYLESSNRGNDPRYEDKGFVRVGQFSRPDEQVSVSRMWREPR